MVPGSALALEQVLSARVNPALAAALLIGQRMNIEDAAESQGYALADAPQPVEVDVASLLHVGQPYNGSARSFRPALFAAAVLAELGIATVLHGVAAMPPKEAQTLRGTGRRFVAPPGPRLSRGKFRGRWTPVRSQQQRAPIRMLRRPALQPLPVFSDPRPLRQAIVRQQPSTPQSLLQAANRKP